MNLELFGDLPLPILAMVVGTYANALKKRNGVWIGRINRDTLNAFDVEFGRAMGTWRDRSSSVGRFFKVGALYNMHKSVCTSGLTYYSFECRGHWTGDKYILYPINLL